MADVKHILKQWSKEKFWGLDNEIKNISDSLLNQWDYGPYTLSFDLNERLNNMKMLFDVRESYWKHKACENNGLLGDRNTKYFFHKANRKRRRCNIHCLTDEGLGEGGGARKLQMNLLRNVGNFLIQ